MYASPVSSFTVFSDSNRANRAFVFFIVSWSQHTDSRDQNARRQISSGRGFFQSDWVSPKGPATYSDDSLRGSFRILGGLQEVGKQILVERRDLEGLLHFL